MSFPQSTPEVTRWIALVVAILLVFPSVISAGIAVKAGWTGTARYYPSRSRYSLPVTEQVTREASPEKFREAVHFEWFRAILFGSLALGSFYFYRRLSE